MIKAEILKKFENFVMSFSFQERKKRELEDYRQEKKRLKNMESDELELEYINVKSEYRNKKNILLVFMILTFMSILIDIWKYFNEFAVRVISMVTSLKSEFETLIDTNLLILDISEIRSFVAVGVTVIVILVAFAIFVISTALIMYTKRMRQIYKELLIIEEVRKAENVMKKGSRTEKQNKISFSRMSQAQVTLLETLAKEELEKLELIDKRSKVIIVDPKNEKGNA